MATIARLDVLLGMKTGGMDAGARKGISTLNSLATAATGLNSAMGIAGTAINAIKNTIGDFQANADHIDSVGKLSDRLGFSTEDLASLQHGAALADISAESVNASLQKMVVNIGKASKGDKVGKVFTQLGLDAKKLAQEKPADALGKIADRLNALPNAAERNAAAIQIFGKSGAPMLTMLKDGSAGMAEMRKEADALGITFDKLSTIQVEAANDAMTRVKASVTGLKQSMAIGLAPWIEATSVAWTNFKRNLVSGNVFFTLSDTIDELNNKKLDGTPLKQIADAPKKAEPVDEAKNLYESLKKSATKDQEERNRLFQQGLSPLEEYRKKVDEINAAFVKLHQANLLNLIDDKKYGEQKAALQMAGRRLDAEEYKRRRELMAQQNEKFKSLRESTLTPGQKRQAALADIQAAVAARQLSPDQAQLLRLQADKTYAEAQPAANQLGDRAGAVSKGSAEAFHASLGQRPADKIQAQIKKIDEQILLVMQRIEQKTAQVVSL